MRIGRALVENTPRTVVVLGDGRGTEAAPEDRAFELNGLELQRARTRQMAFTVAQVVAELSYGMTLLPGDVVLTGTPSGIGNAREPQIFLDESDELVTRIDGLGELCNVVQKTPLTAYSVGAAPR